MLRCMVEDRVGTLHHGVRKRGWSAVTLNARGLAGMLDTLAAVEKKRRQEKGRRLTNPRTVCG